MCFLLSAPQHNNTRRDLPRGTTAGQLFRRKGVFVIEEEEEGEGEKEGDAAAADDDGGGKSSSAAARAAPRGATTKTRQTRRFNVNNRLVDADTPLNDGDLVILSHHVLNLNL